VAKKRLNPRIPPLFEFNYGESSTPGSHMVDIHYKQMGIDKLWTTARVARMCRYLNITEYELASLIMLPHKDMKNYLEKGRFPGIVCWCLTLMELCLLPEKMKDSISNAGETFMPYEKIHEGH